MLHPLPCKTLRRGSLSLGLCRGAVTGTKLDVVAKLVIHFRLAALGTQGVVCDPLGSAVSCPGTLLAQGNLPNDTRKMRAGTKNPTLGTFVLSSTRERGLST